MNGGGRRAPGREEDTEETPQSLEDIAASVGCDPEAVPAVARWLLDDGPGEEPERRVPDRDARSEELQQALIHHEYGVCEELADALAVDPDGLATTVQSSGRGASNDRFRQRLRDWLHRHAGETAIAWRDRLESDAGALLDGAVGFHEGTDPFRDADEEMDPVESAATVVIGATGAVGDVVEAETGEGTFDDAAFREEIGVLSSRYVDPERAHLHFGEQRASDAKPHERAELFAGGVEQLGKRLSRGVARGEPVERIGADERSNRQVILDPEGIERSDEGEGLGL